MSAVKNIFSPPKTPSISLPAPQDTPAPPTVDDAQQAAQAESDGNKRRGRLATVLTPSNTSNDLTGNAAPSLKRMLGA